MKINIKPIPKYIIKKIKSLDKYYLERIRFFSYLTTLNKQLARITVACRNFENQWFCKQVAVHFLNSEVCYIKDINYSLMGLYVNWYDKNISKNKRGSDDFWQEANDKYFNPVAPIVNKKYLLKFEKYKYSHADIYPYNDLFKYLKIYEEYPEVEYLMKMKLFHLSTKKTIIKKLKKDKLFRKWIKENANFLRNEYGDYPYFSTANILTVFKKKITLFEAVEQSRIIKSISEDYSYKNHLIDIIPKNEILYFNNYLKTQSINISSYVDYISACKYLKLDLNCKKNKYPRDFQHWHDVRIDEYHTAKLEEDAIKRKKFYAQFNKVASKYLSLQTDGESYIAIIAKSPKDLMIEGDKLNHCVGRMNYDQKFVREESLIFFIRQKDTPDVPFVTVEYSLKNHKVLQCYGNHNSTPEEKVLNFVNKIWLPYANKKIKKIA